MQAGKLRDRLTIQQSTPTPDGMGGESVVWSTLATVWGSVIPNLARAREAMAVSGGQVQADTLYDVRIRYRNGVAATMRIVWRGNTLEIESVMDPDQHKRELVLMCVAKDVTP